MGSSAPETPHQQPARAPVLAQSVEEAKEKEGKTQNNTTFKLEDIKEHVINALNEIPEATFKKTFEHTLKIEKSYWDSDGLDICPIVQPITINAASASVDSCSSSSSSYSSSSSSSSSEYSDSDSDE